MSNIKLYRTTKGNDTTDLLSEIELRINAVAQKHGTAEIGPYLGILEDIGRTENVKNLIENILDNPEIFESIFPRFYHHQNGFDKLTLIDSADYGWKLRLHIWWEKAEDPDMYDIHDHSANFASKILIGGILNHIYVDNIKGQEYFHYKYSIDHKAMKSTFFRDKTFKRTLAISKEEKYLAGDTYKMDYKTLHKAEPIRNKVTATIVIKCSDAIEFTSVYKEQTIEQLENVIVSTVNRRKDLKQILNSLAILL